MTRKTSADFDPQVLVDFDAYVHGALSRRGFLAKVARYAGGALAAELILQQLNPRFAAAQQIAADDARLKTSRPTFPSPEGNGTVTGYLVEPVKAKGKSPLVLVVHENRGLNPHIQDIARRLALEGFVAFAPDALAPLGGYPGDEDKARELFGRLDQTRTRADFIAAAGALKVLPQGNGKLGVIGFCYGGGMSNVLATKLPELAAAVPFYGPAPNLDDVPAIHAPLLLHFADKDERVNATWPPYEAALKAGGKRYVAHTYPGTQHGFNNDTTPRYDEAAAKLAWSRSITFLREQLA
ncbi:MAG: carboxymethylenebutenolidase [Lysobacterales bacterium 69-70]|nr:dienelactone hydrolase family protein [Xanthomonadaceae bacterium]ODU33078.1 MAG: carboxymethylenebutenolidase [Xanthomonadaceae bacterium SCN 69-320]ODV20594.1 MAG: carboxymethylenebutenolidase [Xanthomonadaceae bacterium SCN 69-25]OJZ00624.1 MAG: carboxymethylenebutenolidase [Xanthomonadales bacterium 69-70]